jgi:light-regulated signal transduction histidine kinase (bacteriophytochrome)
MLLVHSTAFWTNPGLLKNLKLNEKNLIEIESSHRRLTSINNELEQFAYIASHDLQEPVRTISMYVNLLQKQFPNLINEKTEKYFEFINSSSTRMTALIRNLLDYSRIGRRSELKSIDCNSLIENVKSDLSSKIRETEATIKVNKLPTIVGYEVELQLLFQNLIDNALKFRKKGEKAFIEISCNEEIDWVFSVSDNGIGIEELNQERIFKIFHRLHTDKEYEGSGIGLAHCKKIVDLHEGKIWIESHEGQGSTFYFTIKQSLRTDEKQAKMYTTDR